MTGISRIWKHVLDKCIAFMMVYHGENREIQMKWLRCERFMKRMNHSNEWCVWVLGNELEIEQNQFHLQNLLSALVFLVFLQSLAKKRKKKVLKLSICYICKVWISEVSFHFALTLLFLQKKNTEGRIM